MKQKISLFSFAIYIFLFVALAGCDNNFHDTKKDNNVPFASVQSVIFDTVSDCINENVLLHNGIYYSGHYNNDGHGHHGLSADNVCSITNCQETGLHQHNGIHYTGHSGNDACNHHENGHV
jgi:hypothetical protein